MPCFWRVLRITCSYLAIVACVCQPTFGQVASREQQIEQMRDRKAERLEPEELNNVEQRLLWLKDNKILERFSAGIYGFRFKSGGMATGEGFGFGPEYIRTDFARGRVEVRGALQIPTKGSTNMDAQFMAFDGDDGDAVFEYNYEATASARGSGIALNDEYP